jgi:uncharacterized membrane protein
MRTHILSFILFTCCTLYVLPARAGLILCNNTGAVVYAAVAWYAEPNWYSRGWFEISPRDCSLPIAGLLNNRYVYYYARANGLTWEGGQNSRFLCANHDTKFYYNLTGSPPCDGYDFRQIDAGSNQEFTQNLSESTTDPKTAALNCGAALNDGSDDFVKCWTREIATERQREILDCARTMDTPASIAICASKGSLDGDARRIADCAQTYAENKQSAGFVGCIADGTLDDTSAKIVNCAIENKGNYTAMTSCAIGSQLTPEQRRMYDCIAQNYNNYSAAGICLAGNSLSPEQQRLANCVMQNTGSYVQMGVCAAGPNLTSEQQVFVQCAISTGGQPYAFAGCVGTQLTINELQKCVEQGVGGDGCFGKNNEAVKRVSDAWKDVTNGPGPSNDLLGRDGFLGRNLGNAENDLKNGPGHNNDLLGGGGFVGRNFEVLRQNSPPPLDIGTIGGNRICVPWC